MAYVAVTFACYCLYCLGFFIIYYELIEILLKSLVHARSIPIKSEEAFYDTAISEFEKLSGLQAISFVVLLFALGYITTFPFTTMLVSFDSDLNSLRKVIHKHE